MDLATQRLWHLPAAAPRPPASNSGAAEDSSLTNHSATRSSTPTNNYNTNTSTTKNKRRKRDHSDATTAAAVAVSEEEAKLASTISIGWNEMQNDNEAKRLKVVRCRDENGNSKAEAETNSGCKKPIQTVQPSEPPKQDYIHVRARRGQATDSHSLAERARREKISERMNILQDLVPGCNKVIGKASVLDEIINYIQALQCQVEFLSMKLEAVNSCTNPCIEAFPSKEFGGQSYDATSSIAFNSQATREYSRGPPAEWLHMQVGGAFESVI